MAEVVAAVSMCRDEADIAEPVLRHLASQVDFLVVSDNNSTDGTRDILSDLSKDLPLTVLDDPEVAYYQSQKMTALAHRAAERGATWVIPSDFDEVWYSPFGRVANVLEKIAPQWLCATANLYDHVASGRDDKETNPLKRIRWRRQHPAPLPKVACRARADLVIAQGNHSAHYEGGTTSIDGWLVVRHFPYRSVEQMVRKARNGSEAYESTDLPEDIGAHWRQFGALLRSGGEAAIDEVFHKWYWRDDPAVPIDIEGEHQGPLIYDPVLRSVPR